MHNDETSDFMQLIQTIHYCTYAIQATAHGLLIASLFPDCSSSLSAGWNHDEIHAAVWERDVGPRGGDGDKDTGGKTMRGLGVSACVWVDAYVQYVRSLLLFPIRIQVVVLGRTPPPPTVTWTKGFGLEMLYTLSLSCRGFSEWTQSDWCDRLGHITLGPVSKIWPVND